MSEEFVLPEEYKPYFSEEPLPESIIKRLGEMDEELICPSCGNELEWDSFEFMWFCINDWEHG